MCDRISQRNSYRQGSLSSLSRLHLESIEPCGVSLENLCFCRIANIFSLLHFPYRKGFTITMGHVRTENHILLSHELNHLRQKNVVRFRAEKKISFAYIIHWRQSVLRRGLRVKRRKLISRAPKAVIQSLQHEM